MFGLPDSMGRATRRAASIAAACLATLTIGATAAEAETRTLSFYHLHTHEKLSIAYKKDGRYIPGALEKINWVLRDWRMKQPIKMDPRLLDLVWEAYRQSGSHEYIQVICGYRAPATNSMLRSRSSGVAKESQHTQGRALDFYLPDVPLAKMRAIGLKMQVGGVGYYPRSGSPFVHFDVGTARHWPRMSRKELLAVFPNGNTVHVPSDGKPLPGYEQAVASYKARRGVDSIQVANAGAGAGSSGGGGRSLLAMLFGGGGADEQEDNADSESPAVKAPVARAPVAPAPAAVAKVPERAAPAMPEEVVVAAMVPTRKPNLLASGVALPIRDTFDISGPKPAAAVPAAVVAPHGAETEMAALDISRVPLPRFAPERPLAAPALVAAAVPLPTEAPKNSVATLVAALEQSPAGREIARGAPEEMAYSVPTPRERPPFDALLKGEPKVAVASPESIDEVKRILEASADLAPVPAAAQPARVTETAALVTPTAGPLHAAVKAIKPTEPTPVLAAAAAIAVPAAMAPAKPARQLMLVAAIEGPKRSVPVASSPIAASPIAAAKAADVPVGKTGRIARHAARPPEAKPVQAAIGSRIQVASLVTAPDARAQSAMMQKPDAGVLVREVPTSVFTAGFTARPLNNASDRFAGSAVNFLPVAKFD